MISSRRARASAIDDAGRVELGERLVAVAAGLVRVKSRAPVRSRIAMISATSSPVGPPLP